MLRALVPEGMEISWSQNTSFNLKSAQQLKYAVSIECCTQRWYVSLLKMLFMISNSQGRDVY